MFDPNGLLVQGIILSTGIVGQLYVAHMNVRGFYYWLVNNVALIAVALHFKSYGMVGLYLFFGVMAAYSILHWKKRQAESRATKQREVELLAIAKAFVHFAEKPEIRSVLDGAIDHSLYVDHAKRLLEKSGHVFPEAGNTYALAA